MRGVNGVSLSHSQAPLFVRWQSNLREGLDGAFACERRERASLCLLALSPARVRLILLCFAALRKSECASRSPALLRCACAGVPRNIFLCYTRLSSIEQHWASLCKSCSSWVFIRHANYMDKHSRKSSCLDKPSVNADFKEGVCYQGVHVGFSCARALCLSCGVSFSHALSRITRSFSKCYIVG